MNELKTMEFLKIKTNYLGIGIRTIFFYGILLLLILIEIFSFFLIFGSGAGASRVSELWYVDLIFNYLPILIIGGFFEFNKINEYCLINVNACKIRPIISKLYIKLRGTLDKVKRDKRGKVRNKYD